MISNIVLHSQRRDGGFERHDVVAEVHHESVTRCRYDSSRSIHPLGDIR